MIYIVVIKCGCYYSIPRCFIATYCTVGYYIVRTVNRTCRLNIVFDNCFAGCVTCVNRNYKLSSITCKVCYLDGLRCAVVTVYGITAVFVSFNLNTVDLNGKACIVIAYGEGYAFCSTVKCLEILADNRLFCIDYDNVGVNVCSVACLIGGLDVYNILAVLGKSCCKSLGPAVKCFELFLGKYGTGIRNYCNVAYGIGFAFGLDGYKCILVGVLVLGLGDIIGGRINNISCVVSICYCYLDRRIGIVNSNLICRNYLSVSCLIGYLNIYIVVALCLNGNSTVGNIGPVGDCFRILNRDSGNVVFYILNTGEVICCFNRYCYLFV